MMDTFYLKAVRSLLSRESLEQDSSVLVICGEELDAEVFSRAGFRRVTVTNLDTRHEDSWSTGAEWARQDAEALSYADNSFDLVVVHLGLHHCRMPHKALCEMYRVARRGVLIIEPCENLMVRIGRRLGFGQEYEVHAVSFHRLAAGGVGNTAVPNYVYRWTEAEVLRTISSYAPEHRHRIICRHHLVVHWQDLRAKKNRLLYVLMMLVWPALKLLSIVFPMFGNNLCIYIKKPGASDLHPWMKMSGSGPVPDPEWFESRIRATDRHTEAGR